MTLTAERVEALLKNVNSKPIKEELSIRHLSDELEDGTIFINKEYQRNYLYEKSTKVPSKLIESAFLGLVIPEIQFFYDEQTGVKELIDGQQRVLSFVRYYRDDFALKGLELLPQLNGLKFSDLPLELQRVLRNYSLKAQMLSGTHEYKFELFERLNTGSKALNPQEIRNVVYRGPVIELAKALADQPEVQRVLYGLNNQRHAITEGVVRLLALLHYDGVQMVFSPTQNMNYFLASTLETPLSDEVLKGYQESVLKTCRLLNQAFDLPTLFHAKRVQLVHLEPLFLVCQSYKPSAFILQNSDTLSEWVEALIHENPLYLELGIVHHHSPQKLAKRIAMLRPLFDGAQTLGHSVERDARRAFTAEEKQQLWSQHALHHPVKCALCHQTIHQLQDAEVDHIYPWSLGGKTVLTNAQLTHSTCNRIKSNHVTPTTPSV